MQGIHGKAQEGDQKAIVAAANKMLKIIRSSFDKAR